MEQQSELPVYNYIYEKNNLTWEKYMHLVSKGLHEPLDKALWYDKYVKSQYQLHTLNKVNLRLSLIHRILPIDRVSNARKSFLKLR